MQVRAAEAGRANSAGVFPELVRADYDISVDVTVPTPADPGLIAGRYRIERTLGAGGMATVYEAFDIATERRVALKRLHEQTDAGKRQRTVELFEREYHTLSHLAHPRVVEAYDYGVDERGPYYTMELLDGGELSQLAPMPWRRACELARDVCSALSLLHSRRLVYRDLNPRNVHCTSDGRAKLIDFGAMSGVGPNKQVVGTPAYCAPEALDFGPLDARTDLYSLGATLYFTLTGRHAYPARNFEQLRSLWDARPLRPAELVEGLPVGLDNLVMDLLHLEPAVRPANAAEVIEQLAVIEGKTIDEHAQVTQAYLSSPSLVGRENVLSRTRTKITRAQRSRGGVLLFEGPSGVGRSRVMAACRLEAKLQGVLTLHADALDAQQEYGALQAVAAQLLIAAPELAMRHAEARVPVLGHVLPALREQRPAIALLSLAEEGKLRSLALGEFKDWLLAISAERPLLIAVDDLHALDEPSVAALALLARALDDHGLLLIASVESDAPPSAPEPLRMFVSVATSVKLENLTLSEAEQLLRSVFGDVPHLQLLTHRLFQISQGNPRDLMQLAQGLVDRGLAVYRAGAWSLPDSIDDTHLPSNMAQALVERVQGLGPQARRLGLAFTLTADRGLRFEECVALCEGATPREVLPVLEELQRAHAITYAADLYSISQRGYLSALREGAQQASERPLHLALAGIFERRGNEEFRRAQQLARAGEMDRCIDVLVAFSISSKQASDRDARAFRMLVASLPEDWLQFWLVAVQQCSERNRPARDAYVLGIRFASLVNVMSVPSVVAQPLIRDCLRGLSSVSGLDDLKAQVPSSQDVGASVRGALSVAQQRYDQADQHTRSCTPHEALVELSRVMISAAGLAAGSHDHNLALALPSLSAYRVLSPALEVVERLRCGALERVSGRFEAACEIYRDLLVYSSDPEYVKLGESNYRYLRCGVMGALGLMESNCGLPSSLDWAAQIEHEPLYVVSAFQIRMVHALWEGRVHDADKLKEHFDLLRIQSSPRQLADGPYLLGRVTANAASDDLTRIRHTADDLAALAARHAPWWAASEYALGEYNRIRGKHDLAQNHFDAALSLCDAGTHPIWPYAAAARVQVLREQAQLDVQQLMAARSAAEQYLAAAEAQALGWRRNLIKLQLALTLSELQQPTAAAELADSVLESFIASGSRGLLPVIAYETRARVALAADDVEPYERCLTELAQLVKQGQGRALRSKFERVKRSARAHGRGFGEPAGETQLTMLTGTQMRSALVGCSQPRDRAQRTLELLLRRSGAAQGMLFWYRERGRELVAQVGDGDAPDGLTHFLDDFMQSQMQEQELNTCSQETDLAETSIPGSTWVAADGAHHHAVLLSHQAPQGYVVTGLAILRVQANAPFENPTALASNLSRALVEAGDVVPMLLR